MKKITACLLAFMLLFVCGCTAQEEQEVSLTGMETEDVLVTDMLGREVVVPQPVERVVALTASDCEILYAIGAQDLLVGRGEYCNYPPEVESIPVVQSGDDTNTEEIIALQPQVVLMSDMAQTDEQIAALEQAGTVVVATEVTDIEGVYEAITLVGEVVNKPAEAEALITSMQERFAAVSERARQAEEQGKSIYFEISPLEFGLWTAGQNTFMDEISGLLMLENIFADVDSWAQVSQEQVIERNPDAIVTVHMNLGDGAAPAEEIKSRAGWQNITAVQNDAVYQVDNDAFTRPGPRLADAAESLCDLIYG